MTSEEMITRYEHLYDTMKASKDVKKMKTFGRAEQRMFKKLVSANPGMAKEWLAMLESVMWNNYLSAEQADELAANLINQDGSKGPHWSMDAFFSVVPKLGGQLEDAPAYNKYALWLVANAHYSDFARSTAEDMSYTSVEDAPGEKMALSMYKKAVESLKDVDRAHYIADYYHV